MFVAMAVCLVVLFRRPEERPPGGDPMDLEEK
jgi:hypothetical protein